MSAITLIKTAAISSARFATVQKAAPALSWAAISRRAYATDKGEGSTEAPKQATTEESTEKKADAGKTAEELTAALAEKEKKLAEIQVIIDGFETEDEKG
jgi:hypothetical protein